MVTRQMNCNLIFHIKDIFMRYFYFKLACISAFLMSVLFPVGVAYGQAPDIEIDTQVSGAVTVCGDAITFTVTLRNISSSPAENIKLYPMMPSGLSYVANSATGMTLGVPAEADLFFAVGDLGITPDTREKVLTFQAKADCNLIVYLQASGISATLVNNNTKIKYNLNGVARELLEPSGSESYSVSFAELEVFVPQGEKNIAVEFINRVKNRHITIKNSGHGKLSSVDFYLKIDNALRLDKLELATSAGPITLTYSSTHATLGHKYTITDFSGASNGDAYLDEGEQVTLTDYVAAVTSKTSIETIYTIQWGCNGLVCNPGANQAKFSAYVEAIGGTPNVDNHHVNIRKSDFCDDAPAQFKLTYKNHGSGNSPATRDGAFNASLFFREILPASISTYTFSIQGQDNSLIDISSLENFTEEPTSPGSSFLMRIHRFNFNNIYNYNVDGIGGLEDLDEDGYYDDLPVGNTLTINVDFKITFEGTIPQPLSFFYYTSRLDFVNWAGGSDGSSLTGQEIFSIRNESTNINGNADLVGQSNILTFDLVQYYKETLSNTANATFEFEVSVPESVVLKNVTSGPNVLPFSYDNGKYIARHPLNKLPTSLIVNFEFAVNCTSQGTDFQSEVSIDAYWYSDYSCPNARIKLATAQKDIFVHCGNCEGIATTGFKVERNTLGWIKPSANKDAYKYGDLYGSQPKIAKVTKATPGINLSAAYPRDEIEVVLSGTAPANPHDNISAEIIYKSPFTFEAFVFSSAAILINGQEYQLQGVQPQKVVNESTYSYTFNVPLGGTLPQAIPNATIQFKVKFIVADLPGIENGTYPVKYFRGAFFSFDQNNDRVGCMGFGDDKFKIYQAYVVFTEGHYTGGGSFGVTFTSDNMVIIAALVNEHGTSNHQDFPNEFRPINYIEDFSVTLPKGFLFDTSKPLASTFNMAHLIGQYDGYTYSSDRRTVTLKRTDNLPVTNHYYTNIYAYVKIDCTTPGNEFVPKPASTNTDTRPYVQTYSVKEHAYLAGAGEHTSFGPKTVNLHLYNVRRSNLRLTANSHQDAYSEQVKWPLQLTNPDGSGKSTYTWVAVELQDSDESTIIEGFNDVNGNSLTFERYGPSNAANPNGKYIYLNVGTINPSNIRQYEVVGRYMNCEDDLVRNIDVYASWDSYAYPKLTTTTGEKITTSIKTVRSCESILNAATMSLKYKTADLQWNVLKGGPAQVELCVPVPFEIDLTSTKYADMQQLRILMDLPDNVTIDQATSAFFQYPYANTPVPMPANAFITENGKPGIDISKLTGGNLPGIRVPENKIKLMFSLITSCGFDPGLPVKFTVIGYTNCGDTISYVDQRKIKMEGFELDDLELNLSASLQPAKCSNSNDITLSIKNNGVAPSSQNKLEILLPHGTTYQQIVSGDLGEPSITSPGNQVKLEWPLPASYLLSGVTKTLTFRVLVNSTPDASTEISFEARTLETGNLVCAADSSSCSTVATSGSTKLTLPVTGLESLDIIYDKFVCAYQFKHRLTDENDSIMCSINSYLWDFGDGITSTSKEPYHAFNPGTYTISLTASFNCNGCGGIKTKEVQLTVDEENIIIDNVQIIIPTDIKQDILNVSASTFSDSWPLAFEDTQLNSKNSFINGSQGVWRNDATYVYQEARGQSAEIDVSKDGTFELKSFNWEMASLNAIPRWTQANAMTAYSPFSYELENRDVLGVYSSALYDYGGHLPSANGVNMRNREMAFTSFEFPDGDSQLAFYFSNGVTGNWNLGDRAVPTYRTYPLNSAKRNVAIVEVKLENLEGVDRVDVKGRGFVSFLRFRTRYIQDNLIVCRQQHPENPDWSILVFERPLFEGIWDGEITVKNSAAGEVSAIFDGEVFHSGLASLKVSVAETFKQPLLHLESGKAYQVSAWVSINRPGVAMPKLADGLGIDLTLKNKDGQVVNVFSFVPEGKIIEGWQQVKGSFVCPVNDAEVAISFKSGSTGLAWYDDLRLHPLKGNMKGYVYDTRDYRLRAILDEENFASFFYYDQEGNLYLTKKETEDGIKTLTENVSYQVEQH